MNRTTIPTLIIVADDLTGAADSAARCVQSGLFAEVWLDSSPMEGQREENEPDVISVSTDSRFLSPDEAAQRVQSLLAAMAPDSVSGSVSGVTWYKKIDSTLRGNLGAELEAMLHAMPSLCAVVSPGFPAQGRGLEEGKLVYADAPLRHLPALLAEQSDLPVGAIGLDIVRQGVGALRRALDDRRAQGERLLVVDGMTDADLATIVAASVVASSDAGGYLLCGSAGMVGPLALHLASQKPVSTKKPAKVQLAEVTAGPILAVVGSGSRMAHDQVAQVVATNCMRVRALDNNWYEMDLLGAQNHPVGDWLLHLAPPADDVRLEGATARVMAARLADVAYAAVARLHPRTLLVVGGDSAYYVLRRLGIKRLTVVEELLPGIALTFGYDAQGEAMAVVLKPGNFGDEATLVTLHEALRERQRTLSPA